MARKTIASLEREIGDLHARLNKMSARAEKAEKAFSETELGSATEEELADALCRLSGADSLEDWAAEHCTFTDTQIKDMVDGSKLGLSDLFPDDGAELERKTDAAREMERLLLSVIKGEPGARQEAERWLACERQIFMPRRHAPVDTQSSASRQHFIDTGKYLQIGEAEAS